jgi:DNA-binding beta-propeller fold protein YncE
LLWILVLGFSLLVPLLSSAADLDVQLDGITIRDGALQERALFFPGEEIQVSVRIIVLQPTGNPFVVRLRISGDGWHEIHTSNPLEGPGVHTIPFEGLQRVAATAGRGKVSLLLDVFSAQDTVALLGPRHAYLNIGCPPGLPTEVVGRFTVGATPREMALTADGRYLYVASQGGPKLTVIDVEAKTVAAEIEASETIGFPAGVAPSPSGREMYITYSESQAIHVVDAETHVFQKTIPLNPPGVIPITLPGGLTVNPLRNEAYVIDSGSPRLFVVDLASEGVRVLFLFNLFNPLDPPAGLLPLQVMLDPENPRSVYVLCAGLNEIIKLDVVRGVILDFVRLRNLQDPTSLWPVWSMALNLETRKIYVVVNPDDLDLNPLTFKSKIFVLPKDDLRNLAQRRELLLEGSSIWELEVREDGRFVYAIDSDRGEILVIDMVTQTEMSRCAIPVEPGGRLLRADSARNRLFVGGWLAGFVNIVE